MEEQEKEEIIEEIISDEVEAIEENYELEEIEQAEEKVENTKMRTSLLYNKKITINLGPLAETILSRF